MKRTVPIIQICLAVVFTVLAYSMLNGSEALDAPRKVGAFFGAFAAGAAVAVAIYDVRRDRPSS